MTQRRALRPPRLLGSTAAIAALVCACLLPGQSTALAGAWLAQWLFWIGLALGAIVLQKILELGGAELGRDGVSTLRPPIGLLPLLAVLFVPIVIAMKLVYPWAAADDTGAASGYLNMPFFVLRSLAYLALWVGIGRIDARRQPARLALILIALVLSASFAAIDWCMSLMPSWHSAVFGLRWLVDALLSAAAFGCLGWARLAPSTETSPTRLDAAHLLLALTLGWLYLAYVDYVTIWAGNLPDEIAWYVPRVNGPWFGLSAVVVGLHGAAALLLLMRTVKRDARALTAIALLLLLGQWLQSCWLVLPTLAPTLAGVRTVDVAAAVCIAATCGAWLARPRDPRPHVAAGVTAARRPA